MMRETSVINYRWRSIKGIPLISRSSWWITKVWTLRTSQSTVWYEIKYNKFGPQPGFPKACMSTEPASDVLLSVTNSQSVYNFVKWMTQCPAFFLILKLINNNINGVYFVLQYVHGRTHWCDEKQIRNPTKRKSCNFRQCHAIRNFVRILLIVSHGIDRSLICIITPSFD